MKDILEHFLVTLLGAELPGWAKVAVSLTNVFLILLISWVLLGVSRRLLRALNGRMTARSADLEERKRIDTLVPLSQSKLLSK